jgi:hypothetical protein
VRSDVEHRSRLVADDVVDNVDFVHVEREKPVDKPLTEYPTHSSAQAFLDVPD